MQTSSAWQFGRFPNAGDDGCTASRALLKEVDATASEVGLD